MIRHHSPHVKTLICIVGDVGNGFLLVTNPLIFGAFFISRQNHYRENMGQVSSDFPMCQPKAGMVV